MDGWREWFSTGRTERASRTERGAIVAVIALLFLRSPAAAETPQSLMVRGKEQRLHLYGPTDGPPVVVASGDGGWIHLGPEVAEFLGAKGWFVVGVDSKAYLSSFTSGDKALDPADVPKDFRAFVDAARHGRDTPVLLAGVSEGAGLSVLAASDPALQPALLGVLGLGLPDKNELAWRWRDSIIYVTKGTPKEPLFSSGEYIPRLGPVPLAALHSTRDEFVPLDEVKRLLALPGGAKRLFVVEARDHRFSDKIPEMHERLLDAIGWLREQPRGGE